MTQSQSLVLTGVDSQTYRRGCHLPGSNRKGGGRVRCKYTSESYAKLSHWVSVQWRGSWLKLQIWLPSKAKFYHPVVQLVFWPVFALYEWDPLFYTPFSKMVDANILLFVLWKPLSLKLNFGITCCSMRIQKSYLLFHYTMSFVMTEIF